MNYTSSSSNDPMVGTKQSEATRFAFGNNGSTTKQISISGSGNEVDSGHVR